MFTSRYFSPRYWASRYWAKVGGIPVDTPYATLLLSTPISANSVQQKTRLETINPQLTTLISDKLELYTTVSSRSVQVNTGIQDKTVQLTTWIQP